MSNDFQKELLSHAGILGMKWGVRRYQNKDGSLTKAGKKRYYEKESNYATGDPRSAEQRRKDDKLYGRASSYDIGSKMAAGQDRKKATRVAKGKQIVGTALAVYGLYQSAKVFQEVLGMTNDIAKQNKAKRSARNAILKLDPYSKDIIGDVIDGVFVSRR